VLSFDIFNHIFMIFTDFHGKQTWKGKKLKQFPFVFSNKHYCNIGYISGFQTPEPSCN